MKALIFDSGTLINLSMNGLLPILEEIKKIFDGKLLITEAVHYETFDRPIGIPKFELGAIRIQNLVDKGILEFPKAFGIEESLIKEKTKYLMDIANHYIQAENQWIKIVSEAEISCLALSEELSKKGIETIIAIDERTTRLLAEGPEQLEKIMSSKLQQRVKLISRDMSIFSKFRFIRSSEIVFVAYKKGLINLENKKTLEALLYATKFQGAAISFEEIDQMKKL